MTKRELVSNQIRTQLEKRAAEFRIVLDDVSITHLTFSREYTNAVEAKQVGTYFMRWMGGWVGSMGREEGRRKRCVFCFACLLG